MHATEHTALTRLARIVVIASLVFGLAPTAAPPALADAGGLVFGAFAGSRGSQTRQQATAALEAQIGRKLEVVRVFERWESVFPDSFHTWNRSGGRTMILSVKPVRNSGSLISWSSIANAAAGSRVDLEMRSWADRIRDFGAPMYVTLHHEPEAGNSASYGSQADYIAAWRHWVDVFREEGATNVRFIWIMTDYSFWVSTSDRRRAGKWFPGDDWIDAMGIDAYNWAACRPGIDNPWKSLQQIVDPFRQFGAEHPAKELWLTEWASCEDPATAGHKAQWFTDARSLFRQPGFQQFRGISYFNRVVPSSSFPDCDWWVDSSTSSLNAFVAMGNDAFYARDGDWTVGSAPRAAFTSDCTDLRCGFDGSASTGSGEIASWAWDFGDGRSGSGETASHSYTAAGTYPVTLTVTDSGGLSDHVTHTVTVTDPNAVQISFVDAAQASANSTAPTVRVPSAVRPGDGLLLFVAINTTATINDPTGVTGWHALDTVLQGSTRARVYWKVATAADAGAALTVGLSAQSKAHLVVAAYHGTGSSPVAGYRAVAESTSTTSHAAPEVDVAVAGDWVVTYWSHKDSVSTTLAPPNGVTRRASGGYVTGSGRVIGLVADSDGTVATGPYTAGSATAQAASAFATMWSIVLRHG